MAEMNDGERQILAQMMTDSDRLDLSRHESEVLLRALAGTFDMDDATAVMDQIQQ